MKRVQRFEEIRVAVESIGDVGYRDEVELAAETLTEACFDENIRAVEPVSVSYSLTVDGETVHALADVRSRIATVCCRCLKAVDHVIDLRLATDYLPAEPDMPQDLEAERQSSEIGYYRREIDLGKYILSEVMLALPLRFVCSDECKGLCVNCGADLNNGPCGCKKEIDPRLAKLAELRKKI